MIYSYKQESGEELLKDHIEEILEILSASTDSKAFKFVEKLGILKTNFINSLKITAIFHDFGKIFYQNLWRKGGLSFAGHERISAFILERFLDKLDELDMIDLEKLKSPMLFAVLYHHHAMGRRWVPYGIRNISELKLLLEEFVKDASQLMEKYSLQPYLKPLKETILEFERDLESNPNMVYELENLGLENALWESYVRGGVKRTLMLLSLSILTSLDYEAAKRRRGGEPPFYRAVKEFIKNYLEDK